MNDDKAYKFALKNPDTLLIDSEVFISTTYLIKENNLVIDSGKCGRISIKKENLHEFINELSEIANNVNSFNL